jgi:hypothetical protein
MIPVARFRIVCLGVLLAALMAGIPAQLGWIAEAGTIDFASAPGTGTNSISGTNYAIVPAPAWAVGGGTQWISYAANTGCYQPGACGGGPGQPVAALPPLLSSNVTATFYQTFTVRDPIDTGTFWVWADDTAAVWLDPGTITSGDGSGIAGASMLIAANPVQGGHCANSPVSCGPGMDGVLPVTLSAGTYTLVIDAYQLVSATPFGVMYSGALAPADAPEPASSTLFGLGLAGLGLLVRRRKRA